MTGWLIALGILILLAILPLGVSVIYNEDGPLVRIIAGFVRIKVFPLKKKEKKAKKEKKRKTKPKDKAQKSKTSKQKKEPSKKGGSILDFMPLLRVAVDFLNGFRKKLRVNRLELKLILAGGDPCDLALNYGKAWEALGNITPYLDRVFVFKKRDINVECDFEADKTLIFARLDLTIILGRLLGLVFVAVFRALKVFLKIMKKRKGGANL